MVRSSLTCRSAVPRRESRPEGRSHREIFAVRVNLDRSIHITGMLRRAPTAAGVLPLPTWAPVIGLIASGGFVVMHVRGLLAGIF
jgi:hypothetical protein